MVHSLATAIQNAVQGYHATYDEGKKKKKKRATTQPLLDCFFQESRWNWIQQGGRTCAIPGMSEISAFPLPPIADGPPAVPSPTSPPSSIS